MAARPDTSRPGPGPHYQYTPLATRIMLRSGEHSTHMAELQKTFIAMVMPHSGWGMLPPYHEGFQAMMEAQVTEE